MSNHKKNKVITKDRLIKLLAEDVNIKMKDLKAVYTSLENRIKLFLSEADETQNVSIHLFSGISLSSEFLPDRKKLDNLTGKQKLFTSKIKPKANVTRRYMEKLNQR